MEENLDNSVNVPQLSSSSIFKNLGKPPTTTPSKLTSQEQETLQKNLLRDMMGGETKEGTTNDDATTRTNTPTVPKKPGRAILPLKSLINVEALLLAGTSGEDTISSSTNDSNNSSSTAINPKTNDKENPTILYWEKIVQTLQKSVKDIVDTSNPYRSSLPVAIPPDLLLKEATQAVESLVNNATTSFTPEKISDMVMTASRMLAVDQNADVFKTTLDSVVAAAEIVAKDQGLDVSEAAAQARATTKYTAEFLRSANGVLLSGYVKGGEVMMDKREGGESISPNGAATAMPTYDVSQVQINSQLEQESNEMSKPLFHAFESASAIPIEDLKPTLETGSVMSKLAGAIYQDREPIYELGHSIVANGTEANVAWMVTDAVGYESNFVSSTSYDGYNNNEEPILVRTITLRGFDASDETVDRELLLNQICTANPVPLGDGSLGIRVHNGLYDVAKSLYPTIMMYIDALGPRHRVVLNGHSIGGSLSLLIMMIMVEERGAEYVNDKLFKVFTFGSPPIAILDNTANNNGSIEEQDDCSVLSTLGLENSKVYGYAQPWDPIVRLFSQIDACYPLIGDLGDDGVTLYASGPARTLRPITRAIVEAWQGWPAFRDNFQSTVQQNYTSIGMQHLLLPDPGRYITDRLLSVNIAAHPIEEVIRISPKELYGALDYGFPLDVFSISMVPAAIRSFIHHFYPAYGDPFVLYTAKKMMSAEEESASDAATQSNSPDWSNEATKWILGDKFGS